MTRMNVEKKSTHRSSGAMAVWLRFVRLCITPLIDIRDSFHLHPVIQITNLITPSNVCISKAQGMIICRDSHKLLCGVLHRRGKDACLLHDAIAITFCQGPIVCCSAQGAGAMRRVSWPLALLSNNPPDIAKIRWKMRLWFLFITRTEPLSLPSSAKLLAGQRPYR